MSRTPVLDKTIATMAQLALETGEVLPDSLSPDQAATAYLIAYTENGGRLSSLAQQLGVSRFLLQRWIWGNEERKHAYARARTQGADAIVDEGGDLLDSATRDTIAVANARAGWRKWLAGKYDPETWGEKPAGPVVYGDLHLHALQRPQGGQPSPSLPAFPLPRSFPEAPPALGPETMGGGEVPITAPDTLLPEVGTHPISRGTPPSTSPVGEASPSKNYIGGADG